MDKGTQHYINEERARCAALVKLLRAEPDFLVFCIETPVHPGEDLAHWRKQGLLSPHDAKFGALTSTLMADSSKEGAVIGALEKSKSPFYSALEKNVADVGQNKMTGDQWLGTLSNKPGVKPEELDWTGLQNFLKEKGNSPVTKAEVQGFVNDNKVNVGEVSKGKGKLDDAVKAFEKESSNGIMINGEKVYSNEALPWLLNGDLKVSELPTNLQPLAKDVLRTHGNVEPTKYHSYQLPGGNNYRETLLTLPPTKNTLNQFKVINEHGHVDSTWTDKAKADAWAAKNNYTVREDKPITLDGGYKSSHWDEPNVLAHIRTNERDVGGVPSHHIEEIQSDWHQQGRDRGYKSPEKAAKAKAIMEEMAAIEKAKGGLAGGMKDARWQELDKELDKHQNDDLGVPDAPFKKSWPELAMKRAIRQAVEEGKSRVSWTPGEAQAARYDLSKSVDTVQATKLPDGTYNVHARPLNDAGFTSLGERVPENKLADIVGKDLAEKISKQTVDKASSYKGLDLKIGGEGMKGFYDEMLPKMVERIGKKYGVKVKTVSKHEGNPTEDYRNFIDQMTNDLHDDLYKSALKEGFDKDKAKRFADRHTANIEPWQLSKALNKNAELDRLYKEKLDFEKNGKQPIHYFDIPEKMKHDVLTKGFSLFSNPLPIPTQRDK